MAHGCVVVAGVLAALAHNTRILLDTEFSSLVTGSKGRDKPLFANQLAGDQKVNPEDGTARQALVGPKVFCAGVTFPTCPVSDFLR